MDGIILASASQRRREILKNIGLNFKMQSADIDETIDESVSIEEAVMKIAEAKAKKVSQENHFDDVVVAADTVVVYDSLVLTKPVDEEDAFRMLNMLSGNTHEVVSAVCVIKGDKMVKRAVTTRVHFYDIDSDTIERYIKTEEPFGKAGAYAIQGIGGIFVKKIEGDYYNVVGLPLSALMEILRDEFDINIL